MSTDQITKSQTIVKWAYMFFFHLKDAAAATIRQFHQFDPGFGYSETEIIPRSKG